MKLTPVVYMNTQVQVFENGAMKKKIENEGSRVAENTPPSSTAQVEGLNGRAEVECSLATTIRPEYQDQFQVINQ